MKYHLKIHKWVEGLLHTIEHEFEELEQAIDHAAKYGEAFFKIYDHEGNLCHSGGNAPPETYAYS